MDKKEQQKHVCFDYFVTVRMVGIELLFLDFYSFFKVLDSFSEVFPIQMECPNVSVGYCNYKENNIA